MEWNQEARARLERVPFFIRKKVKQQIEEYVQRCGRQVVTSEDVTAARQALAGGMTDVSAAGTTAPGSLHGAVGRPQDAGEVVPLKTSAGSLSGEQLAHIERLVEKGVTMEGLRTRFHEVKLCGGAAGCPLTLVDDKRIGQALAEIIDHTGLDSHLAGEIDGPVLFHHRFRIALAGCPNSCSQPQIVDLGIVGQSRPGRGEGQCTGCNLCVETCAEKAIVITDDGPVFDYDRCLNCGDCTRVCPVEAIREEQAGFKLMAGGKLGRHPRLAGVVMEMTGEGEMLAAVERAIKAYMEHGLDGERFAAMVERLGIDWICSVMEEPHSE